MLIFVFYFQDAELVALRRAAIASMLEVRVNSINLNFNKESQSLKYDFDS